MSRSWPSVGLEDEKNHQEDDHSKQAVDHVHHLAPVDHNNGILPLVCAIDASSHTFGAIHFLLQCNMSQHCSVTGLQGVMQSFIGHCFTAPSYLELLPQHLEALLHPFQPWFIQPLHKLALITLLLGQAQQNISRTARTVFWTTRIKGQVFGIPPMGNPRSACQCSSPQHFFMTAWRPCSHFLILTTCIPVQSCS